MRRRVWVLTRYVEEEPGHPAVYRPIVTFDKAFVDQMREAFEDEIGHRSDRHRLVWGYHTTQHLVEVPNSEGRE